MRTKQKPNPRRVIILNPPKPNDESDVKEKLRAAAYCRVSTGSEEQLTSYRAQVSYYENYLSEHPDYRFCGIYADEGISGTSLKKRDAFNRMLQDCREGKLDVIVTKSVSRFGRNTVDCLKIIRELKALGIDVYFEKENIHTMRSEGEVLLTLISAVAQTESEALSDNVKWGIHRRYEQGRVESVPCGKFYGYDKNEEGKLVIDEAQAEVIRRIYQEFLEGYSYCAISRHLTVDGIPPECGGKEWSYSVIKKILTNEKLMGDTRFQKTYNVDPLTKHRVKNTGELPQPYLKNTHPAIIDRETWECVQLEFARQERFCKEHYVNACLRHTPESPFSGKVTCACCGHTFNRRQSWRKEDYASFHWRCVNFRAGRYAPVSDDRCTSGVRISDTAPQEAFMKAWNDLVANAESMEDFPEENVLQQYRKRELVRLVETIGRIETPSYELVIRTLDHIEVDRDGTMRVVWV